MNSSLSAVVLAAGKGTRMNSVLPKVLHRAAGRPILDYVLDCCRELKARTVVVVGHQADAVRAALAEATDLSFVTQEPQLGTGHAAQIAFENVPGVAAGSVLVLAGDVPLLRAQTLLDLCELREKTGAGAALVSFRASAPGSYGRIIRDVAGRVARIVEARDATDEERAIDEVNASVYVFDGHRLRETIQKLRSDNAQGEFYLTDVVEQADYVGEIELPLRIVKLRSDNAQGEFYLTDVVGLLVSAGDRVESLVIDDPLEAMGVNTLVELAAVERELYARRASAWIRSGVSIERPDTVLIGPDVRIERDARLRAFTIIEGQTMVAEGASVGPFCRVEDSRIGAGATILDSCLVRNSIISAGASVGPFAHIRPDSVVGENAKVGNFVELKKTSMGRGSKAPHLSYLGDATIGEGANIGAGTITCNYDGVVKSPTTIDDGAFVGSNSILVAPVRVGRRAYVAAGSVITKEVPDDALGVGRARQENKPGWAIRRRHKR